MKLTEVRRIPTIVNVICFLIVVAVSAVFLLKPLHAVHRGFFCDDEAIRFPYRSNTISVELLIVTSFVPAVLMVFVLETIYGVLTARYTSGKDGAIVDTSRSEGLRSGLERSGLIVACLFYGNCLCYSLTEIVKLSFGTLRPSFLSACQPATDVTSFPNCSGWFIEDIVCQNTDVKLMIDMRKSFLSGHASFAVFNMLFIIFYLQRRLPSSTPRLAVSLLQTVAAGYAIFVCATRIYDHYHYPGDVVGGSVLGIVCSWVTMFKICPAFIRHPPRTQVDFLPTSVIPTPGAKQGSSAPPTSVTTKE